MRKAFKSIPIIFSTLLCGCNINIIDNIVPHTDPIDDKYLESISVIGMTSTFEQFSNFYFDGECTARFSIGSSIVTPEIEQPNMAQLGEQDVTVNYTYKDNTAQTKYKIYITNSSSNDIYPVSLEVHPYKTEYQVGDFFNFTGEATVTYSNGMTSTVNPTSVTSPDMSKSGKKEIRIGFTQYLATVYDTYEITVSAEEIDPEDPEESTEYIVLSERNLEIEVDSTKKTYLTVDFINCEHEYDVTWESSNENVALVSQYGGVYSANKRTGTAVITCTTASGKSAKCVVNVVTKIVPKTERYYLVEDLSSLDVGDVIVIASPDNGVTASNNNLHMKLNPVTSTFSSDFSYITSLGEDTAEFILSTDSKGSGFTLENQNNQYLASTHEGKVTFVNNKGNIHWNIYGNEYDDITDAVIDSEVSTHGYFMFNIKQNYFTTYVDSNIQPGLLVLPKIYRLTYI